jgi:uncharacterized membrane-anchored protein
MRRAIIPIILLLLSFGPAMAKGKATPESTDTTVDLDKLLVMNDTLHYRTSGVVSLSTVASMDIPKGFKYLDGRQAAYVLHDLWKNPYSESLGLLLPEDRTPYSPDCWAVNITYEETGHVKDDDAKDIKYDKLLSDMQTSIQESNPERVKAGGRAMELIGWAEKPYYDATAHKLYWAKKLRELVDTSAFLNYNIRILGRKGVLVLNAIGGIDQLAEIKQQTPAILAATNFTAGNTYGDFDSNVDKVAAYGIAGLIAGGILAKTGLFAKLGIFLLKFLKPLIAGFAAFGAWIVRFFRGRREGD